MSSAIPVVAKKPSVISGLIGASADPTIEKSSSSFFIPFRAKSKLYRKVAQAPATVPVFPKEPNTYAFMKSADMPIKDIDKCLELALFPIFLDCKSPPIPS